MNNYIENCELQFVTKVIDNIICYLWYIDVNGVDEDGKTPLMYAMKNVSRLIV